MLVSFSYRNLEDLVPLEICAVAGKSKNLEDKTLWVKRYLIPVYQRFKLLPVIGLYGNSFSDVTTYQNRLRECIDIFTKRYAFKITGNKYTIPGNYLQEKGLNNCEYILQLLNKGNVYTYKVTIKKFLVCITVSIYNCITRKDINVKSIANALDLMRYAIDHIVFVDDISYLINILLHPDELVSNLYVVNNFGDLHTNTIKYIIDMFHDSIFNISNIQLFFISNNTSLMNNLRRDEIYLLDTLSMLRKRSEICSLYDFKYQKDQNIELDYLYGRFGAIPVENLSEDLC